MTGSQFLDTLIMIFAWFCVPIILFIQSCICIPDHVKNDRPTRRNREATAQRSSLDQQ